MSKVFGRRKGFMMYDPFILIVIFVISVALFVILYLSFASIISGYEEAKLNTQVVTDIDYELQLILSSNCEFDAYVGYNFVEILGLKTGNLGEYKKTHPDISLIDYSLISGIENSVLQCIYQNGALPLSADVNGKVARFYVKYDEEKLFETYSDPSGIASATWTSLEKIWEIIGYAVRMILNDAGDYLGVIDKTNPDFEYSLFKNPDNLVDQAVITIPVYPEGIAKVYLEMWNK